MTENEQVQEMAKIIGGCKSVLHPVIKCHSKEHGCYSAENPCYNERVAERLYAKDYRKVERGEWLRSGTFGIVCSKCLTPNKSHTNFCPSCGADMRGEKDAEIY